MGGLSQKHIALLRSSQVKVSGSPRRTIYSFDVDFSGNYFDYSFLDYSVEVEVVMGGHKIELGTFEIYRASGHIINNHTPVVDTEWTFGSLDFSNWEEIDQKLAQILSTPSLSPRFFYYLAIDIAKQLKFKGSHGLIEFNISFEYKLKDSFERNFKSPDFVLNSARVYTVGFYEEIDPYNLGEIDFKGTALRLLRQLDYQLEFGVAIEIVKWWAGVFKKAFVEFYNSLFTTPGIAVLKKQKTKRR